MNTTRNVSFVWITFFIFSVIISFSTCKNNIGLGGSVDIEHPRGAITYPDAGETPIRGSFVIKGTARDDEGISSISAVFKNKESGEKTKVFPAEPFTNTAGDIAWTIKIDNESTGIEEGHPLVKVYPIPDGEYEALVTLTDKNGKKTVLNQTYKIDNTPPVFIVSRPSTITGKDETPSVSDGYGAIFTVVGQVGERHTVEKLSVHVDGSGSPIEMTNMFVGKNINAQVAVYSEDNPLYKLQAQNLSEALKSQMFLYDNAREFNGTASAAEGNKAKVYYLRDSIFTAVLQKGYTAEVISDYFAGKKGVGTDDHNKKIRDLRGDAEALAALNDRMVKMQDKRSTFKLDPSKSPGFKVVGVRNLPKTGLNPDQASSIMFRSGIETSFIVELVPNKDKTPLVAGYTLDAYRNSSIKIVLLKPTGSLSLSEEAEAFKKGTGLSEKTILKFADITQQMLENDKLITVADGNLRVKCILPADFEAGRYLLKVTGTDTSNLESNTFAAYDDSNTVTDGFNLINFVSTGNGPRIRLIRPHGFYNKKITIEADVGNLDAGGGVYYNINSAVSETDPNYTTKKLDKAQPGQPENLRYKKEIDISALPDGIHKIFLLAKNGSGGQKDTDNTEFEVDKTPPGVALSYPEADDPQAGKITISGTIEDVRAGVDSEKTKWIIGKKSPAPLATDTGWQDMEMSTSGSWNFKYDFDTMVSSPSTYGDLVSGSIYKVPVYIRSEDKIGNAKVDTFHILFDKDGTKPIVKVLAPADGIKIGGTIQLFGIASVPKGGPAAVGEVYIQFSKSGNFSGGADGQFGTSAGSYHADWQTGGGQLIPNSSGGEWRLEINGNEAFNPTGSQTTQDVYYKLRGKNKDGVTWGNWTAVRKIIIDKDSPIINGIKIADVSDSTSFEAYQSNMWVGNGKKLTARLSDPSDIKEVEISSAHLNGGFSYKLSAHTIPSGWLTAFSAANQRGFDLSIPINLNQITNSADGKFEVKIIITENTANSLKTETTLMFRFDTAAPAGRFGEYMSINNGSFGRSSTSDSSIVSAVTSYMANPGAAYSNLGILIGKTPVTVTGQSSSGVTFNPQLSAPGNYNYILYKKDTLIHNTGSNNASPWIIRGVADDEGSGIKEVRAKVEVNGAFSPEAKMTEIDSVNKITKQLGGQVTWEGQIDLHSLPDGNGKLHYQIIDRGGNTYNVGNAYGGYTDSNPNPNQAVDVIVKNKSFEVQTITLKTDIGGSGVEFENTEQNKALKNVKTDASLNLTADFESTNFAFKNKDNSKIKIKFTGGQGQIKYRLKKGAAVLTGTGLKDITRDSSNEAEIDLKDYIGTGSDKIGNSNGAATEIVLELWDSALGFTPGTNSASATIKIKTLFDALDSEKPVVVILPFHWNSEADNSLYQNSRANGHVEIGDVAGLSAGSSVSGKITVRGFAYDNIQLNTLTVTLPNTTPLAVTATRTANSTNWTSDKNMADHGAELLIEETKYDYLGYYVKWKLEWDTEKAAVGTAKDIKVIANDGTNSSLDSADSASSETTGISRTYDTAEHSDFAGAKPGQFILFTKGEAQHLTRVKSVIGNRIELMNAVDKEFKTAVLYKYKTNKPSVKVNVVPYITRIETPNRINSGLNANTVRSSDGKYSIIKGNVSDFIAVKGFNLASPTVRLVKTADITNADVNTGFVLSPSSPSNSGFKLDNNLLKSGYLEVFAGSGSSKVRAVNNVNDNTKPYNKEEDIHILKNKTLNDNRYLRVFDIKETDIKNGYYPEMIMDGNDPVFGYLDLSGYHTIGGVYPKSLSFYVNGCYQFQRAKFNAAGVRQSIEYLAGAIAWDQQAMAKDESGRYHHVSVYNYANAGLCYIYDRYGELHKWGSGNTRTDGWGPGTGYNNYGGVYAFGADNNALALDSVSHHSLLIDRYRYPKLFVKGNSKTGAASVYMAYYDDHGSSKGLMFRNFQVGTTVSGTPSSMFSGGISSTGDAYAQKVNFMEDQHGGSTSTATYNAGRLLASPSASQYFDLGVTSNNRVVLVYFDETESRLKLCYSQSAVTGANPISNIVWTDSSVVFPDYTGTYVSMDIDSNNGIHIAAFDSSNGDLKYFYLSSYDSSVLQSSTVDAAFSVGQWTQVKVYGNKPYIAYYNNSEAGQRSAIKLAIAKESAGTVQDGVDAEGFVTGHWECMTVPTVTPAQGGTPKFKKVNLGFDTAGRPVLGYLGNNIEFGKWLDE